MIESKAITFTPNGLNVNNNVLPPYNKPTVNMMEVEEGRKLVSQVDELKTPLVDINKQFLMNNLSPICNASCKCCLINPKNCEVLKDSIQDMMNQIVIVAKHLSTIEDIATLEIPYDQVEPLEIPYDLTLMTIKIDPVVPLTTTLPTHFPYVDTMTVSCIYDSIVYFQRKKVQDEPLEITEPLANITGTGGVNRSGRIFAPVPHTTDNGGTSSQDKGKQVKSDQQRQYSTHKETPIREVEEFLRIIKKSDYKVVEKLNQTP